MFARGVPPLFSPQPATAATAAAVGSFSVGVDTRRRSSTPHRSASSSSSSSMAATPTTTFESAAVAAAAPAFAPPTLEASAAEIGRRLEGAAALCRELSAAAQSAGASWSAQQAEIARLRADAAAAAARADAQLAAARAEAAEAQKARAECERTRPALADERLRFLPRLLQKHGEQLAMEELNALEAALRDFLEAVRQAKERKIDELETLQKCKVCFEKEADALFLGCNHCCVCMACAAQLSCCPLCRRPFAQKEIARVIR